MEVCWIEYWTGYGSGRFWEDSEKKEVVVDWGKSMFSGRKSDGMYETC